MKYLYLISLFTLFFNCKNKEQTETLENSTFRKKNDSLEYFTRTYINDSTFLENGYTKNHLLKTIDTLRLLGKNKEIGSLIGWSTDLHHINDRLETVMMSQNLRIDGKIIKNQAKFFRKPKNMKQGVINNDLSFYYKLTKDSIILNIPENLINELNQNESYLTLLCSNKLNFDYSNRKEIKDYNEIGFDKKTNSGKFSKYIFFDPKSINNDQKCFISIEQIEKSRINDSIFVTEIVMYIE